MFKLEARQKARAYNRAVASGEVIDSVITHGTDEKGNVIGDDGKPVDGTAPKGRNKTADAPDNQGDGTGNEPVDYTKFTTHADLDAELAKLNQPAEPEGWKDLKVADKQVKLAELAKPSTGWN